MNTCDVQLLDGKCGRIFEGRVGSIIAQTRLALKLDENGIVPGMPSPPDFNLDANDLRSLIAQGAASIGKIVLTNDADDNDTGDQVLASCFRIGADPLRFATAAHVGAVLARESERLAPGYYPLGGPRACFLRKLYVVFEASGTRPEMRRRITWIELCHPRLDLLLFRTREPVDRPGLPLTAAPVDDARICVLGYPSSTPAGSTEAAMLEAAFPLDAQTRVRRASPGLIVKWPQPGTTPEPVAQHDATTLGGSSGSAVISLSDGGLIGLHFGGRQGDARNRMIYLPHAFAQTPALKECFDPDVANAPLSPWPDLSGGIIRRGVPLQGGSQTAEDVLELTAPPDTLPGAAPGPCFASPPVLADRHDIRDRYYHPPLRDPLPNWVPAAVPLIREQGIDADCTGCALAAAIECLLARQGRETRVSARMLYEMARLNDEFVDDTLGGSSLRGAIKGFFHNGVCAADPGIDGSNDWYLSIKRAREAREITLGAYYRLRPSLPDFQMAIQEVGAVLASAWTHDGWTEPKNGRIEKGAARRAAHAFVLVGYDGDGFWVQNSWGKTWGGDAQRPGLAHWSYADWAENIIDAWVLQTAAPAPEAHELSLPAYTGTAGVGIRGNEPFGTLPRPRGQAILGHIAHAERYGIVASGRVAADLPSIRETALYLRSAKTWDDEKYDGIVLLFHDPVFGPRVAERLASHTLARLKAARLYPFNILYGADELRSIRLRLEDEARQIAEIAGKTPQDLTGFLDRRARTLCQVPVENFLNGLAQSADIGGALWKIVAGLGFEAILPPNGKARQRRNIHVVCLGFGAAIALAALGAPERIGLFGKSRRRPFQIDSVTLLAPVGSHWGAVLNGMQQGPRIGRFLQMGMGGTRMRDTALKGYHGDWCHLLAKLMPLAADQPVEIDGHAAAGFADWVLAPQVLGRAMAHIGVAEGTTMQ